MKGKNKNGPLEKIKMGTWNEGKKIKMGTWNEGKK